MERPGTVTAAAVILFGFAGLALLACGGLFLVLGTEPTVNEDSGSPLMIVSGFLLLSVLLNGWLGYYLLQGRSWARITTIVLCSLSILVSAISLMTAAGTGPSALPGGTCFGIVLNIVIVGLLSGQTAGHYFRYADY